MSSAVASKFTIRSATPADRAQIDAIREPYYGGFPMLNDPGVRYIVAERDGVITALYGMKVEIKRALISDFYGTNARDWRTLFDHLLDCADKNGVELSAWCDIRNKRITRTFFKSGAVPHMILLRRPPQGSK